LSLRFCRRTVALQPGLNGTILLVKVVHVGNQVLDDVHVRQWVNLRSLVVALNFAEASQGVDTANVHGARATNAFAARPPEGQGWIHLIFDLDESVQDHGAALVQVHVVLLHAWLVARLLWVPSVNGKLFVPLRLLCGLS